ncbi:MAG: phospholipase D-like domain-containing protein [Candidatus Scalindua sp.]
MKVTILQNSDGSFYKAIEEGLDWADNIYLGVAYANYGAFDSLKSHVQIFLRNNGKLRALFDIEQFVTEKKLIEELATIPGDSECKVFINTQQDDKSLGYYHPKFYLFHNTETYRVIIGSSNFTLGGLRNNVECNLSIYGTQDELFSYFLNYFDNLWTAEHSINILNHGDLLDIYQKAFQKNTKADQAKAKNLQKLRSKIQTKAGHIVQSKKVILNEEFAYLLGLISANSKFKIKERKLTIDLHRGLANKGKPFEGHYHNPDISDYKISQYDAHKKDVDRITENLKLLIKQLETRDRLSSEHIDGYHFQIHLRFDKDSVILREILNLNLVIQRGKVVSFVPESIIESNKKIIISFLKGYCDLKSRISVSDGIYDTRKRMYGLLRMGISLPHNAAQLMEQFLDLFKKIGVEKGVNATDPSRRSRENLIRIDVRHVPYELIGTHWRRILVNDFVSYMKSKKGG